ncbi:hypothetical protein BpHYR1_052562 [Brachionus plicatilis]|uniref:Uncharacterized protein n=1 Tax=Brachionus plicatilis TaxID=10195 RepID=A0A3M7P9X6_BRAPC|nr:hypothetical protein BpHYR1_052562 [Brachionus plicatilis]
MITFENDHKEEIIRLTIEFCIPHILMQSSRFISFAQFKKPHDAKYWKECHILTQKRFNRELQRCFISSTIGYQ